MAWLNAHLAGVVDDRELLRLERKAHRLLLTGLEMDALDALQRADGNARAGSGMRHIELHDLVALAAADVLDRDGDLSRGPDIDAGRDGQCRVLEARVAQAMTEREERRALEEAIGAAIHGVVSEGGELLDGLVERDRHSSAGVHVSEEHVGERGASFFAGIPELDDRRQLLDGPGH